MIFVDMDIRLISQTFKLNFWGLINYDVFTGGTDANIVWNFYYGGLLFEGPRSIMGIEETSSKRSRPFFSSPDDLFDEEYYDEQLPEKKRRLTPEQVHTVYIFMFV